MTQVVTPINQFNDVDGNPLESGYIYIGTQNLDPVANPITVYWDEGLTITASQPIRTLGGYPSRSGAASVIYVSQSSYSIKITNKNGSTLFNDLSVTAPSTAAGVSFSPTGTIAATDVQAAIAEVSTDAATATALVVSNLALSSGSSLVGFIQSGSGAVARTVQSKAREIEISALDFSGVDTTGSTNSTTGLLNFYNYCISTGMKGRIPAGTYKVTPGVLIFDNNQTDKAWPVIETDGHYQTIFQIDSATETDAPVLQWKNGTATSGVGKYWRGGKHGGLTVKGSGTGASMTSQHHFDFTGMWATEFGWMRSDSCKGNSFNIPQNLYGGTNPDPYAVSFIDVDGLESNFSSGYGFKNNNWVGMDSWKVNHVRIIQPSLGGWFGIGSGNLIDDLSFANITGWAWDDGTFVAATGGAPQRNIVRVAEFDNVQNGIRMNRSTRTDFLRCRIVHRFQTTPNASAIYWPVTGIDLAGGASPSISDVSIDVQHRIEAGGVLGNLGTFLTGNNNGNIVGTRIFQDYLDNGALGVTDAMMRGTNINNNVDIYIARRSTALVDFTDKALSYGRGSAATTVPNSGFGTASSRIAFPTQVFVTFNSKYDTSTSTFTAPRRGLYFVEACLPLAVAVGTRIRMALMNAGSLQETTYHYAVNAGTVQYKYTGVVLMNAGDTLYLMADQNTATAALACSPISTNDEVRFIVTAL